MFGWPFSRNCLPSYHLKPANDPAYQRVLTALSYANPHISFCPLLPPLLHVMLHFLEEYECFAALHHLLQRKAWLDQDVRQVQASLATLRALGYTHIVSHTQSIAPTALVHVSFTPSLESHVPRPSSSETERHVR